MPNTYSQIYIQIVFAVKDRLNLIQSQIHSPSGSASEKENFQGRISWVFEEI